MHRSELSRQVMLAARNRAVRLSILNRSLAAVALATVLAPVSAAVERDEGRARNASAAYEATVARLRTIDPAWSDEPTSGYRSRRERGVPEVEWLEHFDRVERNLYRGHSPDFEIAARRRGPDGVSVLRALGVTDVVTLKTSRGAVARERRRCAEEGITLHSVPLPAWDPGIPIPGVGVGHHARDVARAVALVGSLVDRGRVVYVHCSHGRDRTGLVVAMRRLLKGSDSDAVLRDAHEHGMSFLQCGMRRFVKAHTRPDRLARFRALVEHATHVVPDDLRRTTATAPRAT